MLKKSLLILLLVGTVNNVHGFLGFGGGDSEDRSNIPQFDRKVDSDKTFKEAQVFTPVMAAFIDGMWKLISDVRKEEDIKTEQLRKLQEKEKTLDETVQCLDSIDNKIKLLTSCIELEEQKKELFEDVKRAEANKEALEAEIKCYQKKNTPQEDVPSAVDQQDSGSPDERDLTQQDKRQELKVAEEQKDVQPEATLEKIKEEEGSI